MSTEIIPEGTDLILRTPGGDPVTVTLMPDGSVALANLGLNTEWLGVVRIDGASARVLRDWFRRELVG
jgi:hypothetical protein